jgi:hypothetical protein
MEPKDSSGSPLVGHVWHASSGTNMQEQPLEESEAHAAMPPVAEPGGPEMRFSPPPKRGRLFSHVIVPLIVFVVVVAGIAYVVQKLPSSAKPKVTGTPAPRGMSALKFEQTHASWDSADPNYAAEFELGTDSHYDYFFKNPTSAAVQLGVEFTSCGCSKVDACILSPQEQAAFKQSKNDAGLAWHSLIGKEYQGIDAKGMTIPPGAAGVVRLTWANRKIHASTLSVKLWSQAEGRAREIVELDARVVAVPPVRCTPRLKDIGTLGPRGVGHAEFWVWSATRDNFKLEVQNKDDNPCFVSHVKKLKIEEAATLNKLLNEMKSTEQRSEFNTRFKCAYRVNVDVYEQREGHQLDLGAFARTLAFAVDDDFDERIGPIIRGRVRGEIDVGNADDGGRVNLQNFYPNSPRDVWVSIQAPPAIKLAVEQAPEFLKVEVAPKEKTKVKTTWRLHATVKPGVLLQTGPLSDDCAITLRMEGPSRRRIRIPVEGNALPR